MDYESNTVNTFMFPHPKKKNQLFIVLNTECPLFL